jgi:hypothetical protein
VKKREIVMTKIRSGIFAALGLLFVLAPTAASAEIKPTAEQRAACMGDALTFCSSMVPNMDRIASCLAAKKSQLTPRCRAQFDRARN